jgi:CopG family nickel-responsive transcriptional regulator
MMSKEKVSRISISLPEALLDELDEMVSKRGFDSRSQAICDMINLQINEHRAQQGDTVMTGTVNLVYNHSIPGLQKRLHDLQFEYIDEVISSLNVNLTHTNTLSVILVQGPANRLNMIADQMITLRGVVCGRLLLNAEIIPPIHPLPPKQK